MDPILERYQALEDKVAAYTPNLDTKRLFDAFTYADTEHHGQLRKSGEPYIIHPLAVAEIVAEQNGNIIRLEHNQFVNINRQSGVELRVTLEAFGHTHKRAILDALCGAGYAARECHTNDFYH